MTLLSRLSIVGREEQIIGRIVSQVVREADERENRQLIIVRASRAVRKELEVSRLKPCWKDQIDHVVEVALARCDLGPDVRQSCSPRRAKEQAWRVQWVGDMLVWMESPFPTPRLRVRRINEEGVCARASKEAKLRGGPVVQCCHGGTVCNSYGYRANTEVLVVVAFPEGIVVYAGGRATANKVTLRGAAEAAWSWPGAGAAFDARLPPGDRGKAKGRMIAEARTLLPVARRVGLLLHLRDKKRNPQAGVVARPGGCTGEEDNGAGEG